MTRAAALLFPAGPSGLGIYLEHGEGATPFPSTPGDGGETRVFRAELRAPSGAVLAPLALELPGDEPDGGLFPGEAPEGHLAREARWAAAHADRLRLLAAPESFPELILPGTAGELLPPTLFTADPAGHAGRFYRIPCPRCLAPLHTCRDDARLAAAGLPLYSGSAGGVRVLTCAACARAGIEERFYAGDDGKGLGEKVGTLDDLRRELAQTLEQKAAEGAPVPDDVPRPPGAPAGRATTVKKAVAGWTIFNLHDSPYLVTRAVAGTFEGLAARLGGQPEEGAAAGPGLLLALEGSGLDAVEVLALKLAAFEQAVAAVLRHGLLLGRPHLDLHPGALSVEPGPAGNLLPSLWSFRVRLGGGSGARLVRLADPAGNVEVPLPPRHPHPPFASPAVRNAALAAPSSGELLLERATAEKGGTHFRLEGTLLDPHGFFPPLAPRDTVQLALPRDLLGGLPPLAARLDPRGRAQSVEAPLTTEPVALAPETAKRLTQSGGLRVPGVRYRIYPTLGTGEDLYALGMLLVSLLLTHDGQSLSDLEPLLAPPSGRERHGVVHSAEEVLASARAAEPDRLAKSQIFARREDRFAGRPNAIPDELWTEALLLALRLLTRDPVFGLPAPGDVEAPLVTPNALEEARAQAAELFRRATGLLFRRQSVHVEIQAALAELLSDVAHDERAGRPGTSPI